MRYDREVIRPARRSPPHRAGLRFAFLVFTVPAAAAGVIAGCGLDELGSLVYPGDAGENVGASLPDSGPGAATDGGAGDAADDSQIPVGTQCGNSDCLARGGTCDGGLASGCTFDCNAKGSCDAGVVCPAGVRCDVTCAGDDSCPVVDCAQATACAITCTGKRTCGSVTCAGKNCAVHCRGGDSCSDGGVTCDASDSCRIECNAGGKVCQSPVTCTSASCSVTCEKDDCLGGVTANAADASIYCGDDACGAAATCNAQYCQLGCETGSCSQVLCCDAGTCILDGGDGTSCPL